MILTDEQINYIVDKLNDKINLPILGERTEAKIIKGAVSQVLAEVGDRIPKEYLKLIDNVADGILPSKAEEVEKSKLEIATFLNKKVNIPIIGERKEQTLFEMFVEILFDAMEEGKSLAA